LVNFDEYSRTYALGAQNYVTVIGGEKYTYIDKKGELVLIDNTLRRSRARSGENVYENAANDFTIKFPEKLTENKGITLEKENHSIKLIPITGDYSNAVFEKNAVLYNQVQEDVDIQYTVINDIVKEDIIIHEPMVDFTTSYRIETEGLTAKEVDGSILLYEIGGEEAIFCLTTPGIEDAVGELNFQGKYVLEDTETEEIIVTLNLDKEWLQASQRAFPVRATSSPVYIAPSSIGLHCVEQGSGDIVIGDNQYPYVGYDDGFVSGNLINYWTAHLQTRTYIDIDYDFTSLGENIRIDNATFSIAQRSDYSNGLSLFGLYTVDQPWNPSTLTYNNQVGYTHTFIESQYAPGRDNYINYNITEIVNNWNKSVMDDYGFVMKAIDETIMQCEVFWNRYSTIGPSITIEWTQIDPNDPYLAGLSLDDTTIHLRPITEKDMNGKMIFNAVFADGLAQAGSLVQYHLEGQSEVYGASASGTYLYPDSTAFESHFPNGTKYKSLDSNWQSTLYSGMTLDKKYTMKATATKDNVSGKEKTSDSFLVYRVKQFDTFPRIAAHYDVPLNVIMKDNRVQDSLVIENNTIFIRNPKVDEPYNPEPLDDETKMAIDGALMGRGLHCEYGFEPINLNTGNFFMESEDFSMSDLGGDFGISRTYNSKKAAYNSVFGRGWEFEYSQALSMLENGKIVYMRGDGSYLYFEKDGDGTYRAPAGYQYDLKSVTYEDTAQDFIGWELTDSEKTVYSFDKYGMLRLITDAKGFCTTLEYEEEVKLSKLIAPSGKEYKFTVDDKGRITTITLPTGEKISYTYDTKGNLIEFKNQANESIKYTYDDSHQMTEWYDENGNRVIKNTYDSQGRVLEQIDANGNTSYLAYTNGKTTTTDNMGYKTIYHYDAQYRTTKIEYPDGTIELKNYNTNNQLDTTIQKDNEVLNYTYDSQGNVTSISRGDGRSESYEYNAQNLVTSITDYAGNQTKFIYDDFGNLITTILADGGQIKNIYDSKHRVVEIIDANGASSYYQYASGPNATRFQDGNGNVYTYEYDSQNRLIKETNPLGGSIHQKYDKSGNLISSTREDGGETKTTFDAVGNVLSITDPSGRKITFEYDAMYNLIGGTDVKGNETSYAYDKNYNKTMDEDALGNQIFYTYDSMGKLKTQTDANGGMYHYTYDMEGNLTSITNPLGNVEYYINDTVLNKPIESIDYEGNSSKFTYDALGNIIQAIAADGSVITYTYDKMNRLLTTVDALGNQTFLTYDKKGNVIQTKDHEGNTYTSIYDNNNQLIKMIDPLGGTSEYIYDALGRLISTTNEENQTETIQYDKIGQMLQYTDASGEVEKFTYDSAGNVIKHVDVGGNITTYTYDITGNITSITDPMGNITAKKYNALGYLIQSIDSLNGTNTYEYNSTGNMVKATDAMGATYYYEYDSTGNQTKVTYPNGNEIHFTYDKNGQRIFATDTIGVESRLTYDERGRLIQADDSVGNKVSYTYDLAGNILTETDAIGRVVSYQYNSLHQLISTTDAKGAVTTYQYDILGRITDITDPQGVVTSFTYDGLGNRLHILEDNEVMYQYIYDELNRVVETINPLQASTTFAYDRVGNLLQTEDANGMKTTYTYDGNRNILSVKDSKDAETTFTYDELGRILEIIDPLNGVEEYRYDALGNLTKYKDKTGYITEYVYDVMGNQIKTISPKGAVTEYTYNALGVITSTKDPNNNLTEYEVDLNGFITKLTQPNGGSYHYEYDKVGRVTQIETPLGYIKSFTYDVGNNLVEENDNMGNKSKYAYDIMNRMVNNTNPMGQMSVFEYDTHGNMTSKTDPLGREIGYAYDLADRLIKVIDPEGKITETLYDKVGNIEKVTLPGDRTTSYQYDENYNLTAVIDPMGNTNKFTYNANNQVLEEKDALGNVESYTYDQSGRIQRLQDRAGNETSYTYDTHGLVKTVTNGVGSITKYNYDLRDQLTEVEDALGNKTTYNYDTMGNLITYKNALGQTTEYTYDLEGNRTSTKGANGKLQQAEYDVMGRLTTYTYNNGNKIQYNYDRLNNLIEKSYQDAEGKTLEEAVRYGYDTSGQRVEMIDTSGTSEYEYDKLGRVTKVTNGSGQTVTYVYDKMDRLASIQYPDESSVIYEYDLNDNLIKVTDRHGEATHYEYDATNKLLKTIRPNHTYTEIEYNANDHVMHLINRCSLCEDLISSYVYLYDKQGNVIQERELQVQELQACGQGIAGIETNESVVIIDRTFVYNDRSELIKVVEKEQGNGKRTYEYAYDEVGNRTFYKETNKGKIIEQVTYRYDASNQLLEAQGILNDKKVKTEYSYDENGNLIGKSKDGQVITFEYTIENRIRAVREGGELLMAVSYDGDGNKVFQIDYTEKEYIIEAAPIVNETTITIIEDGSEETLQSGSAIRIDKNTRISAITSSIEEANANVEGIQKSGASVTNDALEEQGIVLGEIETSVLVDGVRVSERTLEEQRVEVLQSQPAKETENMFWYGFGQGIMQFFGASNQALSASLSRYFSELWKELFSAEETTLVELQVPVDEYEALKATGLSEQELTYLLGTEKVESAVLEELEKPVVRSGRVAEEPEEQTDSLGKTRVLKEEAESEQPDFLRIQTTTKVVERKAIASSVYIPLESKIVKEVDYELTYYLNDITKENTEVLMEYDKSGVTKNSYTYGTERISIDSVERSNQKPEVDYLGEAEYYIYDGRGSVSQIYNALGDITGAYRYDPYGAMLNMQPAFGNVYGYNGESYNAKTGLQYLRARFYDTEDGRFTSEDTYFGKQGNPLTLHKYLYVNNIDPSGHFFKKIASAVNSAAKAVTNTVKNIATKVVATATQVVNAVKTTVNRVVNTVSNIVTTVKNTYTNIVNKANTVRQNIVQSTKQKVTELIDTGKGYVEHAVTKVNQYATMASDALHSVGDYIAESAYEAYENVKAIAQKAACSVENYVKAVDWKRAASGVVTVVAGVALVVAATGIIVATGGLAASAIPVILTTGTVTTAQMVTGFTLAAATATAVMNTAEVIEGAQDIIYGLSGNEELQQKSSFNFVRDTLFEDNPDEYYLLKGMSAGGMTIGYDYLKISGALDTQSASNSAQTKSKEESSNSTKTEGTGGASGSGQGTENAANSKHTVVKAPTITNATVNNGETTGIVVNETLIKETMINADLQTQQNSVSIPVVQNYVDRITGGETNLPPINVDNGIIVDGNHRYIAGQLTGVEVPVQLWSGGNPEKVIEWGNVNYDTFDWGNR